MGRSLVCALRSAVLGWGRVPALLLGPAKPRGHSAAQREHCCRRGEPCPAPWVAAAPCLRSNSSAAQLHALLALPAPPSGCLSRHTCGRVPQSPGGISSE